METPTEVQIKAWLKKQGLEFISPEMIHMMEELLQKGKVSVRRSRVISDGYHSCTSFISDLENKKVIYKEKQNYYLNYEREDLLPGILSLCPICGREESGEDMLKTGFTNIYLIKVCLCKVPRFYKLDSEKLIKTQKEKV
jgi:hypothetical protein